LTSLKSRDPSQRVDLNEISKVAETHTALRPATEFAWRTATFLSGSAEDTLRIMSLDLSLDSGVKRPWETQ